MTSINEMELEGQVAGLELESKAQMRRFFVEDCGQPDMAAQILDAAMRLFARKGYAATSVREIVNEAQVTNPMLYYYFKSKEGVFNALFETLVGNFDAQLDQLLDEELPLKEKLLRMMHQHIRTGREVPTVLRFMFSVIFGPRDSVPPLNMLEQRMCLMKKLAQIFEDAIASGELVPSSTMSSFSLAHNFMGLISNQLMFSLKMSEHLQEDPSYQLMFEHYMSDENTEALVNFFFAGAGKLKETAE